MTFFSQVERKVYNLKTQLNLVEKSTDTDFITVYSRLQEEEITLSNLLKTVKEYQTSQMQLQQQKNKLSQI